MAPRYRLGVDVGGTHTDLVLLDAAGGALAVEKVSTTPKNPALGVMNGIEKFAARGIDLAAIEFFSHGTTITTNALLEMRGAKVGLLINRGFRAIQETQGQARDGNVFDYFFQKPEPIAPPSLTREIGDALSEQIDGRVVADLFVADFGARHRLAHPRCRAGLGIRQQVDADGNGFGVAWGRGVHGGFSGLASLFRVRALGVPRNDI